jgi:hypothetical protein
MPDQRTHASAGKRLRAVAHPVGELAVGSVGEALGGGEVPNVTR